MLIFFIVAAAVSAQEKILWRDPGAVEHIDLTCPAGGAANKPRAPFRFVSEDLSGTNPKILIRDAAAVLWRVKGGPEVKAESFSTRFVAALGYYAEPNAFVARGKVEGLGPVKRASNFVQPDGSFASAALERRDGSSRYLRQDWAWNYNPFLGTRELNGLKILLMLLSNWDNKDARERWIGSNTGILEKRVHKRIRLVYFVNDWGQTLGSWGNEMKSKGWDCASYTMQTASFVHGRNGNKIRFGYVGLHTDDFTNDITVSDVRWLLGYLGRISDQQIRDGLAASGASSAEADCFTAALRNRIEQLRRVSAATSQLTRR